MTNMRNILITAGLILSGFAAQAQAKYTVNGYGRTVVTQDKLYGQLLDGDLTTPRKGVGGYTLFDLESNLEVKNLFNVNAIMRVKSPFGAFWGQLTAYEFRQLQVTGNINNKVNYQIGDIYLESMSDYTIYNADPYFNDYQADVFQLRTEIQNYENFIQDNTWRMQGVHAKSSLYNSDSSNKVDIYSFGVRTNTTNDAQFPDRIMAGGQVKLINNNRLVVSGNYIGLLDVPVETTQNIYKNNVLTTGIGYKLSDLSANLELGISDYSYYLDSVGDATTYNDYFYDLKLDYEKCGFNASVGFKEVGPQFTSPAAQTRRINIESEATLFPMVNNNAAQRSLTLYDRISDEGVYMRSISPYLLSYLPQYNNIQPYGPATPNRRGTYVDLSHDSIAKGIKIGIHGAYLSEIFGEGIEDTRNFVQIQGGTKIDLKELLSFNRLVELSLGADYVKTTRNGLAPIDFSSIALDAGLTVEVIKQIDLVAGLKMINALGNEFLSDRDEFNQPQSITETEYDWNETIISAGGRVRINDKSLLTLLYNANTLQNGLNTSENYTFEQFFAAFILKI